jgi:ribosomal protein S18 acetylase RimI-like enzyme
MRVDDVGAVHESGTSVEAFQTSPLEASETPFWPADRLREWVQADEDVLLVAEAGGDVVGYFLSHHHETTGTAYIENLFVDPPYRRRGIGTELLETGVERIVARGGRYIAALTKTHNEPMQNLLREAGFNEGETFVWMDRVYE